MKDAIRDVAEFHRACDVPVRDEPGWPNYERVNLRVSLMAEEGSELYDAISLRDLPATADAMADLIYVIIGSALEFGIPLDRVWDEVQRANMAKVCPETGKVRRREDGKILKPDDWQPPDIAGEMMLDGASRRGWRTVGGS